MGRSVGLPPDRVHRGDSLALGGWWHETSEPGRIDCDLCPRKCSLKPGSRGFCFVRQNLDGEMVLTTYGLSTGFCIDPIEKKPLNHFLPGTAVLSFGTAGCNLGCKFCQNWDISKSREVERLSEIADPETIARAAGQLGCRSVAFTYNDPVVWAEYAIDTAQACRRHGIKTVAVTAGYISPAAREPFFAEMDAANVDLKALTEQFYVELTSAHVQPVLDCLEWLKRDTDVWFEITNLVIPQANDSTDELARMCDWILEHVGDEVPVHFTAFHPTFKLQDRPATPHETLLSAYQLARRRGLKYVYVGNVHDPEHDSTYCPYCNALLIQRNWYQLGAYRMNGNRCSQCEGRIAGVFEATPGRWGARRQPIRIADYAVARNGARPVIEPLPEVGADTHKESRLMVTEQQQQRILEAAGEFVAAGVQQRPASLPDPTLAGAAETTVMGAFVTLKRQQHLRACCGTLGRPMPLLEALRSAAQRTATEDLRLPPISVTELAHLKLDVSLLHNFQTIPVSGTQRVAAVEVGRHGLTIQRGAAGGLLLPTVPVENGWDAEMFLRQLCRKAGLPTNAWQDADSQVQTFEAVVCEGAIAPQALAQGGSGRPLLSDQELETLAGHCNTNIRALVTGATPNYYLPGCSDANVQGLALIASVAARDRSAQFARLSTRPGLPMQATLFQLCEAAGSWFATQGLPATAADQLQVTLAILHDSALHGTAASADLAGLDTAQRALVVVEQGRSIWLFDPERPASSLLADAVDRLQLLAPDAAGVFSFAVQTSAPTLTVVVAPHARQGAAVRAPAVAGMFYPDDPRQLEEMVDQLLAPAAGDPPPESWAGALVPHAGLRYSGRIAAEVMKQLVWPPQIIILAPKHSRHGTAWAVTPHERWAIPGHTLAGDPDLAAQLADTIPGLKLDALAHQEEHAIEVQLPLLARLAPESRIVGITVGGGDLEHCRQFARGLAAVMEAQDTRPLLLISSDLNHYACDAENRRLDQLALAALQQLDPAELYRTIRDHNISMCGVLPAVIALETLRILGTLGTCRQVGYTTSAEATGNTERVVGYGGMLFR